jgi:phytoene desaturase
MSRAIVIGAGVGGLTAAMKLAHQGWQVDLYEKLGVPGGRCGRVEAQGFTWDLGPTIMLMPFIFEEAFASVGKRLSDYLTLVRCDPNYRVTFRDDSTITLTSELTRMRDELERLEPGSFEPYLKFLAKGRDRHDTSLELFVKKHFDSLASFLTPSNLPHIFRIGAHRTLFGQVSKSFQDERLRQTMSFQTMYLGVSPFEAPAVFSLLPYTELAVGIWYPMGGMGAIPRALEKVCAELGVTLHYQREVSRIVIEGGQAKGVQFADGSIERADVVLCNADYPWAYKHLIDPKVSSHPELEKKRYTSSGYMLYLGVKRRYDELLHHNVYFGRDFEGSFRDIFTTLQIPEDPSFYVNAPAHTDPSMAPAGKDALYVLVPVPHTAKHLDWAIEGPKLRARIFARLAERGMGDLERDVEVERVITPDDWARELNLERGANFGLAQNMFQIGPFRPKVWDERVRDLFFCGASVQPGTGVPTVMISADLCVKAIGERSSVKPSARGVPKAASGAPQGVTQAAARVLEVP